MTETEKDERIATQVRLRQQMEEQQQTLKDLFDWEDSIQKQQSQLQTNKSKSKEEMSVPERRNVDQSLKSNDSESAKINMSGTTKEGKTVNPLNEDDERNRGNAYYSKGNYDEAIRSYSRCISMNPSSTVAYSNRGLYLHCSLVSLKTSRTVLIYSFIIILSIFMF
jgi:tetratricopeptide (TPR) repeat protein